MTHQTHVVLLDLPPFLVHGSHVGGRMRLVVLDKRRHIRKDLGLLSIKSVLVRFPLLRDC